jgi:transposase
VLPAPSRAGVPQFLGTVEASVPADLDIHLVIHNAGAHNTKLIRDWFARRPHWHIHFTPTSASWINQVERFFALLTDRQLRRGAHRSTEALEAAIHAYIDAHNAEPIPFQRTKSADDILAAINRFCLRTLDAQAVSLERTSESGH